MNIEKTVKCIWETSGDGKTWRLVREFYEGNRCVGFEVVKEGAMPSCSATLAERLPPNGGSR